MSFEPESGEERYVGTEVAVVGMAGRFPGAETLDEFWANLRGGVESITWFTDDELRAAGVPDELLANPAYVKGLGMLKDIERFDAAFFGYSPREAEALEPAHRLFLECAWEALEDAGIDPARPGGAVGVYAGAGDSQYADRHISSRPELMAALGDFQLSVGSSKDFFAARAAYKLDLRGPAVSVQTGCSTSLVGVHLAVQALLGRECDVALAGGAAVIPQAAGYLYAPGGVNSPDGHCRPFDAQAAGTRTGSGAGAVVLKRLEDALRDGDHVRAVILGTAINNDGALKVAFTAPSVEGQAAVIGEALAAAGVDARSIRYVEGHGSGTELGDPIEIAALTEAFRQTTEDRGFCAVGSVKASVGHCGAAAGMAGFIKTVLAIQHRELPPTVNFKAPNPKIDFASSPFYVSSSAEPWEEGSEPRRAGVSSFGIGGTNAHVVVEEAPAPEPSEPRRPWHLLTVSAKTATSLDAATSRLANHLRANPDLALADVAWTLQTGRREMAHRRVLAVRDGEDAAAILDARHPDRVFTGLAGEGHRSVAFMFPGVGDQYPNMARGLYESEPAFRAEVDRCAEILRPIIGLDLREVLFPGEAPSDAPAAGGFDLRRMLAKDEPNADAERISRTEIAQPAVFVIEYALAKLWMSWGIVPKAVIGHSLGEYAAACVAGVFSLEDALELVARRARMIQELPGGAMLAVPLSADAVKPYLIDGAVVATINAPEMVTVAGTEDSVEAVRAKLEAAGIVARRLAATHAFHSPMLDPLAAPVEALVGRMRLKAPAIPFVTNVTGTWITPAEATDPRHWSRHMREPVQFERGVAELLREPGRVLLEVGPGQTLSTFVRQRPAREDGQAAQVIPTVRYPYDRTPDAAFLLGALGRLWLAGVTPDWTAFHEGERLRKVPLPTYPWDKQRYWVDAPAPGSASVSVVRRGRLADPKDWLYLPSWRRAAPAAAASVESSEAARWVVFHDGTPLSDAVVRSIRQQGRDVVAVRAGEEFGPAGQGEFTIRPDHRIDYDHLIDAVRGEDGAPVSAVHLWAARPENAAVHLRGFLSLAWLAGALGREREKEMRLLAVTAGAQEVTGAEDLHPVSAALAGACTSISVEHPNLRARTIDVDLPADGSRNVADLAIRIADEALSDAKDAVAALRGRKRYVRGFDAVRPPAGAPLREGGVYLLGGALDGRNEALARWLIQRYRARLVLVDERLPHREVWDTYVATRTEDDPARGWILTIRELEAAGAEIHTVQVHLRERDQADEALREAERRFGTVHGVVVALELSEIGGIEAAADVRSQKWTMNFGWLTAELETLEAALEGRSLDFVALESSLTPLLGLVGRARLGAVHAWVDAFAARHNRDHATPWTAIAWDRGFLPGEDGDGLGLSEDDMGLAFEHVLALGGEPRVAVSTGDLNLRVEEAGAPAAAAAAGTTYARPELATEYFPPTTEAEERIAEMWQELLGIDRIGVHDDFFSLGGHSLLATQITSRVRDLFALDLPLKSVFEAPTVAKFAALLEAAIMAEIEAMSDEEILSLA